MKTKGVRLYGENDIRLEAFSLPELGKTNKFYRALAELVERNNGSWNAEAEAYLLEHGKKL